MALRLLARLVAPRLGARYFFPSISTSPRRLFSAEEKGEDGLTDTQRRLQAITEYYSQYEWEEEEEGVEWIQPQEETFHISLERGETGVFDMEELVEFLRLERAEEVCCIRVPPAVSYSDYVVVCSAKSERHLISVVQRLNKVYKRKKWRKDVFPTITKGDKSWRVVDMGNVVLHVFLPEVREKYNIEELWTVGGEWEGLVSDFQPVPSPPPPQLSQWKTF